MKKFPISVLCGLAAVALTIILFFIILSDTVLEAIHYISLVSIVVTEIITTVYAFLASGNPRKVAAAGLSVVAIPYAIVLSVIYIANYPESYGTYFGWYLAGLVVVNLICLVLVSFNASKQAEQDTLQNAKSNMLQMRKLTKCIMEEPAAQNYMEQLRAIEEELHYTNDSVILPEDERIRDMLLHLQLKIADPAFDTADYLQQIQKAARQRAIMAKR
ncbi:MAG: hypothetical protein IKU57_00460 [Oscillospiraceae bacterium]|nr:hypothetical protein [Oscillospiraceae bacterium]